MLKHKFTKSNRTIFFEMVSGIDWTMMREELNGWPNGTNGYMTMHKEGKPKSPEQLGYYHVVILPAAFQAFKSNEEVDLVIHIQNRQIKLPLTEKNVDFFLKIQYSGFHGEYKDKADMSKAECSAFEDWAIKWLARWMNVHVPPADANWRDNG